MGAITEVPEVVRQPGWRILFQGDENEFAEGRKPGEEGRDRLRGRPRDGSAPVALRRRRRRGALRAVRLLPRRTASRWE